WRTKEPRGIDVSAIEHMDARCLALLREDGVDRLHSVSVPAGTAIALLVTLELPASTTSAQAFEEIGVAREPHAPDTALVRFCRALDEAGVLDRVDIAVPGDRARASQLLAVREAVPAAEPASGPGQADEDRKSTRLNSSHVAISYAVFCLKKKKMILDMH